MDSVQWQVNGTIDEVGQGEVHNVEGVRPVNVEVELLLPGAEWDGQDGQQVAGHPDHGVDDAPDPGDVNQVAVDLATLVLDGLEIMEAKIAHKNQRRLVANHD